MSPNNYFFIHCEEHLEKVRAFAGSIGMLEQFEETLQRIRIYSPMYDLIVHLYEDFAPFSFYFVMNEMDDKTRFMNGGIIFHGSHDGGGNGGAPTFSVNLTPSSGWRIHT